MKIAIHRDSWKQTEQMGSLSLYAPESMSLKLWDGTRTEIESPVLSNLPALVQLCQWGMWCMLQWEVVMMVCFLKIRNIWSFTLGLLPWGCFSVGTEPELSPVFHCKALWNTDGVVVCISRKGGNVWRIPNYLRELYKRNSVAFRNGRLFGKSSHSVKSPGS